MLYKATALKNFKLNGSDGEIGKVKEFYFDDRHWTVRYLVVDTGNWLQEKQVLISPHALDKVNEEEHNISVKLTKKQIEDSPSIDHDKPVSREYEDEYNTYYGWPAYYGSNYMWGASNTLVHESEKMSNPDQTTKDQDYHLRSTKDVNGHNIEATDGDIGHVEDFMIDDENWAIRYLIVDTKALWFGKKVLISPQWISRMSWDEQKVFVDQTMETINQSPVYTDVTPMDRDYETGLYKHYNQKEYWMQMTQDSQTRVLIKK